MKLIFDPEALREARNAAAFYEDSRPGLGKIFLASVESGSEEILRHPQLGRLLSRYLSRTGFKKGRKSPLCINPFSQTVMPNLKQLKGKGLEDRRRAVEKAKKPCWGKLRENWGKIGGRS